MVGVEDHFDPEGDPYRNGAIEHFNGWLQARPLALCFRCPSQVCRELATLLQGGWHEHLHPNLNYQPTAQVRNPLAIRRLPARFVRHRQPLPLAAGKVHFIGRVRKSGHVPVLKVTVRIGQRSHGHYVWLPLCTRSQRLSVYHRSRLIK